MSTNNFADNEKNLFLLGLQQAMPIGLAYLAVGFTIGIVAKNIGLNAFQGFTASLLTYASAGEYACFNAIADNSSLIELAIVTIIINARYTMMSCALGQLLKPGTGLMKRILTGATITDELFGLYIARQKEIDLRYNLGAFTASVPLWALGTALGVAMGGILPVRIVSALSVALYGMFLATVIPPAKHNTPILLAVTASFVLHTFAKYSSFFDAISSGNKIILLTILICSLAAYFAPVSNLPKEEAK